MSGNEVHLQQQLRRAGFRIRYEPGAVVDHLVQADRRSPRWVIRRAYWQGRVEAVTDRIDRGTISFPRAAHRVAAHTTHRAASDAATMLTGPGRRAALVDFLSTRAAAVGYAAEALRPSRE
jgi:hypothetical protein